MPIRRFLAEVYTVFRMPPFEFLRRSPRPPPLLPPRRRPAGPTDAEAAVAAGR
jgi:hypothetical protein